MFLKLALKFKNYFMIDESPKGVRHTLSEFSGVDLSPTIDDKA